MVPRSFTCEKWRLFPVRKREKIGMESSSYPRNDRAAATRMESGGTLQRPLRRSEALHQNRRACQLLLPNPDVEDDQFFLCHVLAYMSLPFLAEIAAQFQQLLE